MQGALTIGRLQADCQVCGAPEVVPALTECATRALRDHLTETLRRKFAGWLDRDDESVWVVRRIEFSLLTATEAPADNLAAALATALVRALSKELRDDGDGVNAMRFANRAAYLGQFVADAAAGDVWSRWYYRPFVGLKALPSSTAIRTALVENPARGLAALASVDDRALARVVAALTARDELCLLDAFTSSHASNETGEGALAAASRDWAHASNIGLERARPLLAFIRSARGEGRTSAGASRLVLGSTSKPESPAAGSSVPSLRPEPVMTTRLGGVYLLLRGLDDLPWLAWTAGWPSFGATTPDTVLKWLTLALCAGRAQASNILDDCAVRSLYAIGAPVTKFALARWLREVGAGRRLEFALAGSTSEELSVKLSKSDRAWLAFPRSAGIGRRVGEVLARIAVAVLRRLARCLPGFADSTPAHLWKNFLSFDATVEAEDERVVVRCGRPPLHLVLALTGMTRGSLAGLDASGRPILLFPDER